MEVTEEVRTNRRLWQNTNWRVAEGDPLEEAMAGLPPPPGTDDEMLKGEITFFADGSMPFVGISGSVVRADYTPASGSMIDERSLTVLMPDQRIEVIPAGSMVPSVEMLKQLTDAIMDQMYGQHSGRVVMACQHCGQWGARFCPCRHCGAPVD